MMQSAQDTLRPELGDFAGRWILRRAIVTASGERSRFAGEAVFTPRGADLEYCERGSLHLPDGRAFAAERRYRWSPGLRIHFDDGRFFHAVPDAGETARHWCAPDLYEARYDFSAWPVWSVRWQVSGPHKAYTMCSRYVSQV